MKNKYRFIAFNFEQHSLFAVEYEGNFWFSQKTIAELIHKTKQLVSYYINDLFFRGYQSRKYVFITCQQEGTRMVSRSIEYYPTDVVLNIARLSGSIAAVEFIVELSKEHGIGNNGHYVISRKETIFRDMLFSTLRDIVEIRYQFRIGDYILDFFIPKINLAIEYDEKAHGGNKYFRDKIRQTKLETDYGIKFIRVSQGKEFEGLNSIIKATVS